MFYGVFVRFSTRGVQKHHNKPFGENPCQKLLAEKVEKTTFFLSSFPIDFFLIAFLAVSLHEEPKNTISTSSSRLQAPLLASCGEAPTGGAAHFSAHLFAQLGGCGWYWRLHSAFWELDPDKLDNIAEAKTTECVQIMEADGWQVMKEAHSGYRKAKHANGGVPISLARVLDM
jgi:hypothetical protein